MLQGPEGPRAGIDPLVGRVISWGCWMKGPRCLREDVDLFPYGFFFISLVEEDLFCKSFSSVVTLYIVVILVCMFPGLEKQGL